MRQLMAAVLVAAASGAYAADTQKPEAPALSANVQIRLLRTQLELAQIDGAMKEAALRYATLQQQQAKAAVEAQRALDEARKACGMALEPDVQTMTCIERKEKK
jgi:hypothetical protein